VIGEHGDSEVLTWSLVTIAGVRYVDYCHKRDMSLDSSTIRRIDERVRRAAYTIIAGKGATYYGVGSALARIIEAVLHDQRAILTVCAPIEGLPGLEDVTLSLPRLVGGAGAGEIVPLPLDNLEQQALLASAARIREAIASLQLVKKG
jgi:L-lactate dehydrogenase